MRRELWYLSMTRYIHSFYLFPIRDFNHSSLIYLMDSNEPTSTTISQPTIISVHGYHNCSEISLRYMNVVFVVKKLR